ncbi:MAG: HEAT repeat domain-containing protein [Polyangiaceae bacterium]|nr:HEAT repeat domain-containing protein [Polyangiaceae bacterium]
MRSASVHERLGDAEPEIRRLATQDIVRLRAPDSCELLLVALGDEDWRVRKEAASVASHVTPRASVLATLVRALGQRESVGQRNAAVEALVSIGPDSVPWAVDALARFDADGRKLAAEVLARVPTLGGIRALVGGLTDEDPNVVVAVAEGLGQAHLAGEDARALAATALIGALGVEGMPLRLAALSSLRALDVEIPWASLEPLLEEPLLRRVAISAAGGSRSPRAVRALAEAIGDPNRAIAHEAVATLGRWIERTWGKGDCPDLDVVEKTLHSSPQLHARLRDLARDDTNAATRRAAILALGLVKDPDDVSLIADALANDDVAEHAEVALRWFGREAVTPLLVAGRSAAPRLRDATISMLPELALSEPPAENARLASEPLAAVREMLSDASEQVVVAALKSLSIAGAAIDLEPVARLVNDESHKVVSLAAASALREIARRNPVEARTLVANVDPRGDAALVATLVLAALAAVEKVCPSDREFLEGALTHRDAQVRQSAIEAFASVGGQQAVAAVSLSLADEEPLVAQAAIRALGRLGRANELASLAASTHDPIRLGATLRALADADPERALGAAKPLAQSRNAFVATAAIEVIGSVTSALRAFGADEASLAGADALMDATTHADNEVVKVALAQLSSTGDERALLALGRCLEHPEDVVRRYAAELVGQEESVEADSLLRSRLNREPSAYVRSAIMEALSVRADRADRVGRGR